jgi:23S rRNA pseudouridine1911/1915/1917 synthase
VNDGEGDHQVAAEEAGMRLDAFVSRRLNVSVGEARRRIEAGAVRVAGQRRPKGTTLPAGARVSIQPVASHGPLVADASQTVGFLYEDEALIAIDKPAGMPSHPLRAGERGTAANAIVARYPECAAASEDPREGGLGHRLDTATSGVLLAARHRAAWLALRAALRASDCQKRYLAEVWGHPPDDGQIVAAIGRTGRRGAKVQLDGGRNPLPARTRWGVLGRGGDRSLLEATLHAGRAHQVRAHLASAGYPIVGDDRYDPQFGARRAGGDTIPGTDVPRLHLHAAAVSFTHPSTAKPVTIAAPPPEWAHPRPGT